MQTYRSSRPVRVGEIGIGGSYPITVQSMTNTDPMDFEATLTQTRQLIEAGCDIVRYAVPTEEAAEIFSLARQQGIRVPLIADIHFDWRIALAAIRCGAQKIRINPGNIGSRERVREVASAARAAGVPIRIGVNGGSLEKHILSKYGAPTAQALAESALYHAELLEDAGFSDIVLSVKASDVPTMIAANRLLREQTDYPLHIGVTEAGGAAAGIVKSAVGIGSLLSDGIGDTVRVSLTAPPVEEVHAAHAILSALGLSRRAGMNIVSCPTCGRTKVNLFSLLSDFEKAVDREGLRSLAVKVAIMGCAVNGPGEARDADIGIAGGNGEALLFRKGEVIGKYPENEIIGVLIAALRRMAEQDGMPDRKEEPV